MFRWLNRSGRGDDAQELERDITRIRLSIQEFIPGTSLNSDTQVIGYCDGCGSLVWGTVGASPVKLSHCERCP